MSKQFKCPKCGGEHYIEISRYFIDGQPMRCCRSGSCTFAWSHVVDPSYIHEIPSEPPRPTEDELMRVAPGWELERYDHVGVGEYYFKDGLVYHAIFTPCEKAWVVRHRPDWAYYQRENAEKWIKENYQDKRIVGLRKLNDSGDEYIQNDSNFAYGIAYDTCRRDAWRWVVEPKEPKESVKELPISYKHRVAACVMIDGNPMTLQKVACYNWETFAGYVYADNSIEADFKRMRNGQVEWATKVRVKE